MSTATEGTKAPGPGRRGSRGARRLRLVLLSLVVFVAAAEAGAWAWFWVRDGEPFGYARMRAEQRGVLVDEREARRDSARRAAFHPYLGFLPRAEDETSGVLALNTDELYDREGPLFRRDPDRVVIAIAGGSLAGMFARSEAGRGSLRTGLLADPRFAGKELVFVALANGGFKQPQQLLALGYLLSLGASLDAVLNVDGFNEVALHENGNGPQGVFPAYPRAWLLRHPDIDREQQERINAAALAHEGRRRAARRALESPWRFSVVHHLIWRLRNAQWNEAVRVTEIAANASVPKLRPDERLDRAGPRAEFASDEELYDELAAIWERSSLQMDVLCRANGIRYFHFLQPNQYVAGSKPLSAEERAKAFLRDHPYRRGAQQGYPRLRALGRELARQGVRFHDLSDTFEGVSETLYIDTCCHINPAGEALLAERMAELVLQGWDE